MYLAGAVFMARSKKGCAHVQLGVAPTFLLFVAFVELYVAVVLAMYNAYVKEHPLLDDHDDHDHDHDRDSKDAENLETNHLGKSLKLERRRLKELQDFAGKQHHVCLSSLENLTGAYAKVETLFKGAPSQELLEEAFYKANRKWAKLQVLLTAVPESGSDEGEIRLVERYAVHMFDAAKSMKSLGALPDSNRLPILTLNTCWDQIKFHSESIGRACQSWRHLIDACEEQGTRIEQLQDLAFAILQQTKMRRELYWKKDWLEILQKWYFHN